MTRKKSNFCLGGHCSPRAPSPPTPFLESLSTPVWTAVRATSGTVPFGPLRFEDRIPFARSASDRKFQSEASAGFGNASPQSPLSSTSAPGAIPGESEGRPVASTRDGTASSFDKIEGLRLRLSTGSGRVRMKNGFDAWLVCVMRSASGYRGCCRFKCCP